MFGILLAAALIVGYLGVPVYGVGDTPGASGEPMETEAPLRVKDLDYWRFS